MALSKGVFSKRFSSVQKRLRRSLMSLFFLKRGGGAVGEWFGNFESFEWGERVGLKVCLFLMFMFNLPSIPRELWKSSLIYVLSDMIHFSHPTRL